MIQGLRHIRAFLAIVRLGSFTRAAAELHVSQPALTVQIRQLEEALGVRLFDRNKRQVLLTAAGKSLMAPLERILIDMEVAISISQDLALLQRGSVTIAALPSVAAGLLPVAMRRFKESHPGIVLGVRDVVAENIELLIKADAVDFAIGSRLSADRDIEVDDLMTDRMGVFCPAGHPLGRQTAPSLQEVSAYPLILTARGSSARKVIDGAFEQLGLEYALASEANYMSTAVGMVRAGLGVAILPQSAVESVPCDGLDVRPVNEARLVRKIGLVRKAGRSLSPAAQAFAHLLLAVAAEPSSHFTPIA